MSADMYVVVPIWRGWWVWNHGVVGLQYVSGLSLCDVVLVVTGRVMYVYGVVVVVVLEGIMYVTVDGSG